MTEHEFDVLRVFLKTRSGLALSQDKRYLVESRLKAVYEHAGLESLSKLCGELKSGKHKALEKAVVDAMTTNETFFFRDKSPFDIFENTLLPRFLKERASTRRLRIWCAAASTGQEPYSIAMILKEAATRLAGWKIDLVASDISLEVLEKAKAGVYNQFEVQRGLPPRLLAKYFLQSGDQWRISPEIRAMVDFRYVNLIEDFSFFGIFDIIYCRNVLIYFDLNTKRDVLARLSEAMEADAVLLMGASETVLGVSDLFYSDAAHWGLYSKSARGEPQKKAFA
jgi:chemotaxis protein methyltransferase CheR